MHARFAGWPHYLCRDPGAYAPIFMLACAPRTKMTFRDVGATDRRALKMNQQRHAFTGVDTAPDKKARAFQTLQFNSPAGNRPLLNSRMRPRVLDHRRRRRGVGVARWLEIDRA